MFRFVGPVAPRRQLSASRIRCLSIKSAAEKKNPAKFSDTINLPKTKFPTRLTGERRSAVQEHLRKTCFGELYRWQRNELPAEGEFVLHDGPPYANGELHMGHAVNKILKDLILKHKMVSGKRVHYVPGWDCHGLPIELKALEAFGKKNKDKSVKLDPLQIRELARKFALGTIDQQKAEFEQWGVTADWGRKESWYRTMDPGYIVAQLKLFQELYEKGLIYRDVKPVFWSPSSRSALAEAELEYDEAHKSPSLYLELTISGAEGCPSIDDLLKSGQNVSAVIWTTTPWTLPANQAICYNPDLSYSLVRAGDRRDLLLIGTDLIRYLSEQFEKPLEKVIDIPGIQLETLLYKHPINNKEHRFFPATHVKAEKGTGLVHTAPAHGPDDFLVFLHRKLPVVSLLNEAGCYNGESPDFLKGKFALTDGNSLVIEYLKDKTLKCGTIEHSYPIDWRTKKPVMLRASDQWFINTNELKESAQKVAEQINIFPHTSAEVSKTVLQSQLQKRPYWCISRQRAWGVPIPVLYEKETGKPIVNAKIIENVCKRLEKEGKIDFWWTDPIDELIPASVLTELNFSPGQLIKGTDILDIWFDSGASWLSVLGKARTADLYLEGLDQFTGWFQSSLLTSVASQNRAPYKSIFVHGFAVDENGMKMSKSLGNIISPKDIIKQYGCDTLRWWVAAHAIQNTSIPVSHKLLQSSAENVQKVRAILKYLLGVISPQQPQKIDELYLRTVDRYFLNELTNFEKMIFNQFESYQYNKASARILTFCVSSLSGFYLHIIKDRLYCGTDTENRNLQAILAQSYQSLCRVLWPILPFLVEESWSYYAKEPFFKSSHTTEWHPQNPQIDKSLIDEALDLKRQIFQQSQQLDMNSWLLQVHINSCSEQLKKLHPTLGAPVSDSELCEILQVGSVSIGCSPSQPESNGIRLSKLGDCLQLCPRCRRFAVKTNQAEPVCHRCAEVLSTKSNER
ncbi:isoleucine--tRNA ligase, mitochondrial [Uranotaenia lowii]|uniref:isoleucine--tRNA ligase, mitochondrial n=1 Tax=Uranotaenia lowii TaxID=190385 RepID=UPI002478422E|nr:isoleucine--tRNA ligase, mitochondrial [Uranotaenia lowii]